MSAGSHQGIRLMNMVHILRHLVIKSSVIKALCMHYSISELNKYGYQSIGLLSHFWISSHPVIKAPVIEALCVCMIQYPDLKNLVIKALG